MQTRRTVYDLKGDFHGQVDKREDLLCLMDYVPSAKEYRARVGRKAVFLVDLIG